jgi:phosphate-selective porin OprO and OprP
MSSRNSFGLGLVLLALLCLAQTVSAQFVVTPAGKEPWLKIGGLLQVQADFGDRGDGRFTTSNDRFYLRRARLNAVGRFLEEFDFKIEIEVSGQLGNNPTISSNLRAQMTDGYINWNRYPQGNIKGGQFKTYYGYEQLVLDAKLFTIERSLATDRLTLGRQIGAAVYGDLLDKHLSYATGLFNGNGVNNSFNDNDSFLYIGRLYYLPIQRKTPHDTFWGIGINGFHSEDQDLTQSSDLGLPNLSFTGTRFGEGIDTQFRYSRFEAWAEYLRETLEPTLSPTFKDFTADGWYVQLTYFVIPQKLQVVGKYETFNPITRVSGDETDSWIGGFSWLFKGDDICFRLNYYHTKVPLLEDQNKVLMRFQIVF